MKKFKALARVTTERAAEVDAYRRLAEKIYGTVINAQTRLDDFVVSNDTVKTSVQGVVRGARTVEKRYYSDGSVSVVMEVRAQELRTQIGATAPEITFGQNYFSPPDVIPVTDFQALKELMSQ